MTHCVMKTNHGEGQERKITPKKTTVPNLKQTPWGEDDGVDDTGLAL